LSHEVIRDEAGNLTGLKSVQRRSKVEFPVDLGSETFGSIKPRRTQKLHEVMRDGEGNIIGLKTDEVEIDDEPDLPKPSMSMPAPDVPPVGPPVPPTEPAPGIQANGLPTPPSVMAPVDPTIPDPMKGLM